VTGDVLPAVLGIALAAAAAAFALLPLVRGSSLGQDELPADAPQTDRVGLYRQVLELEFDHQMGKLSRSDFEQLSAQLLAQAGQALSEERGSLSAIDEQIEREIAAARAAFAAARGTRQQAERVSSS
jgi:hypothetical protein